MHNISEYNWFPDCGLRRKCWGEGRVDGVRRRIYIWRQKWRYTLKIDKDCTEFNWIWCYHHHTSASSICRWKLQVMAQSIHLMMNHTWPYHDLSLYLTGQHWETSQEYAKTNISQAFVFTTRSCKTWTTGRQRWKTVKCGRRPKKVWLRETTETVHRTRREQKTTDGDSWNSDYGFDS